MGIWSGYEKGSGGKYRFDEETRKFIKVSDTVTINDEFNGPVWFPKGGHKYFDKALNKWFYSKEEKKDFLRANKLMQKGDDREGDRNCPEAGMGKRYYSYPGQKTFSKTHKYR